MEFLFTLSTLRVDVDWTNSRSVAKIYYDVFDMTCGQEITVDILALVLDRVLMGNQTNSGHRMSSALAASPDMITIVRSIDLDGNGTISIEEFEKFFEAVLTLQSSSPPTL